MQVDGTYSIFTTPDYIVRKVEVPQIKFSNLFTKNNIDIQDLNGKYRLFFWDTPSQSIFDYSSKDTPETRMFIPIQLLVNPMCKIVCKEN
jgi:hypothetical protein